MRMQNWTNEYAKEDFGFTKENFEKIGRFLVTQGSYDTNGPVGPPLFNGSWNQDRNAARTILVDRISHI